MSQYELLRKANDPLKQLIGQSFNEKSKLEAERILDEIHSKALQRTIGKKLLCYVVDKGELKGVGGSSLMKDKNGKIVSNLILTNYGNWLAAMFLEQGAGGAVGPTFSANDVGSVARTMRFYADFSGPETNPYNFSANGGILVQVGSGSTAPARSDVDIETAFGTAPEDAFFVAEPASVQFSAGRPIYNPTNQDFKMLGKINAGGAGTINEAVLFWRWLDTAGTLRDFAVFRELVSPSLTFIIGQSIITEWTFQL